MTREQMIDESVKAHLRKMRKRPFLAHPSFTDCLTPQQHLQMILPYVAFEGEKHGFVEGARFEFRRISEAA